jgi:hypothetical protein
MIRWEVLRGGEEEAAMAVLINVSPHPGQSEVHNDPHRFKVLAAGRRWGKTRLGVLECIDKAWLVDCLVGGAFV